MTLVTRFFEPLSNALVKAKGMSSLPRIILPYPFDPLSEEEIRRIARQRFPDVVVALTGR